MAGITGIITQGTNFSPKFQGMAFSDSNSQVYLVPQPQIQQIPQAYYVQPQQTQPTTITLTEPDWKKALGLLKYFVELGKNLSITALCYLGAKTLFKLNQGKLHIPITHLKTQKEQIKTPQAPKPAQEPVQ